MMLLGIWYEVENQNEIKNAQVTYLEKKLNLHEIAYELKKAKANPWFDTSVENLNS